MYQIDETIWVVIHPFDTPKETRVINTISSFSNVYGEKRDYLVKYKNREFELREEDVYPDKKTADIFWSIMILQDYENTLKYPDMFLTDEYEIAAKKAKQLLNLYTETDPDLLLKYL